MTKTPPSLRIQFVDEQEKEDFKNALYNAKNKISEERYALIIMKALIKYKGEEV